MDEQIPLKPDALFSRSMAALQRGDIRKAIDFGDRLISVSNSAPAAITWGVRVRLEARLWKEAIALGRVAVDVSPGLSGLLGHAYDGLGDVESAHQCFARAATEQPENPTWHLHNASALSRLYRDFESMEALELACRFMEPPDRDSLLRLAEYKIRFGLPGQGLEAANRVLLEHPRLVAAHQLAARALVELGRFDEAEGHLDEAQTIAPADLAVPLSKGVLLIRHGQFQRGIEAHERLLEQQPDFAMPMAGIAAAKKFSQADRPFMERMERVLSALPPSDHEGRVALGYALGKAYDNLGEYEQAMQKFDQANCMQYEKLLATGGFDREGYTANMTLRTRVYSEETVKRGAKEGDPSVTPIFVLGVIRSGTTLAEQILSSHPLVSGAGELDFWLNTDLRLMNYQTAELNLSALRQSAATYLRLIRGYKEEGSTRVVDKQPGNLIVADALHIAFPNARIIHMRRDPVDTAISIWTIHVRTSARFVNEKSNIVHAFHQHYRLVEHWNRVLPEERFMEMSYESLVTDRERQTRRLLEFCGLPWDDACLNPEKNARSVVTPSLWQVRQPVYRTSIDRWKNYEPWLGPFRDLLGQ